MRTRIDKNKSLRITTRKGYLIWIEYKLIDGAEGWRVYVGHGRNFSVWITYEGHILKTFFKAMRGTRKQNETTIRY